VGLLGLSGDSRCTVRLCFGYHFMSTSFNCTFLSSARDLPFFCSLLCLLKRWDRCLFSISIRCYEYYDYSSFLLHASPPDAALIQTPVPRHSTTILTLFSSDFVHLPAADASLHLTSQSLTIFAPSCLDVSSPSGTRSKF